MRGPVILASLCAILAAVLAVQRVVGSGEEERAAVAAAPSSPPRLDPETDGRTRFDMLPPESYADVSERPLFLRSRRPPQPGDEIAEQRPLPRAPADFVLSGVVVAGTQRLALLQGQGSDAIARVAEGQDYEGWTVETIEPNKVVLRRGQDVTEIVLEDKARRPPPPDRRRDARRRIPPEQPDSGDSGTSQ
ncbi:MAG: hypothetical protein ACFCUO_13335 [Rhodospirillales bacterium]